MCGIAGIVPTESSRAYEDRINEFLACLHYRGPDDQGVLRYAQGNVWRGKQWENGEAEAILLHWRLAIIDLTESGWQPMASADGRYYIVFNGEIYNYLELRDELQGLGRTFTSQSDTEVLIQAYAEWGAKALNRLVGMFAFAMLDTVERKLFLARDFFGIKPLYYTVNSHGFGFASEIKLLLELPGVKRTVNPGRVYTYLRHGMTDHGAETMFSDVHQLPAAHYLEVSLDNPTRVPTPVRYWSPGTEERNDLSFDDAAEKLRELFLDSVRLHLRSDVPLGSALSGGIDSSAIVMAMRHLQGDNLDLFTFSYIADDPAISEEKWVDLVGGASRATVAKVRPEPGELVADLDHLVSLQDEPFGSTSIYAQYRVFRLAKEAKIKVMLDGQGADEILGGYRPYIAARLATLVRRGQWGEAAQFYNRAQAWPGVSRMSLASGAADFLLPTTLQAPLRRMIGKELVPSWLNTNWMDQHEVRPVAHHHSSKPDVLREHLQRTLTETSLPSLLRYEDRNSMAWSIESRVPFLTPALVDFMLSLPESYIVAPDGASKAIFRKAMRGIVPDAILDRRDKIGFNTPEQAWLRNLQPWVEGVLNSDAAGQIPVIDLPAVKAEWENIIAGRKAFDSRAWRWINLIRWSECYGVEYD
jgi:asparagine synthase (glutamine-hydrolysing)